MSLTRKQFDELYHDQDALLKMVYDATPESGRFVAADVQLTLQSKFNEDIEHRKVLGILGSMERLGLLVTVGRAVFQREKIAELETGWHFATPEDAAAWKEKMADAPQVEEGAAPEPLMVGAPPIALNAAPAEPPLRSLQPASLVERMELLSTMLAELASDIALARLEMEEQAKELAKAQQLQAVLKQFGYAA